MISNLRISVFVLYLYVPVQRYRSRLHRAPTHAHTNRCALCVSTPTLATPPASACTHANLHSEGTRDMSTSASTGQSTSTAGLVSPSVEAAAAHRSAPCAKLRAWFQACYSRLHQHKHASPMLELFIYIVFLIVLTSYSVESSVGNPGFYYTSRVADFVIILGARAASTATL